MNKGFLASSAVFGVAAVGQVTFEDELGGDPIDLVFVMAGFHALGNVRPSCAH